MAKRIYLAIIPFLDEASAKRFLEKSNIHGHIIKDKDLVIKESEK